MTREEAKARAEIMMHYANGGDVEFINDSKVWEKTDYLDFSADTEAYRKYEPPKKEYWDCPEDVPFPRPEFRPKNNGFSVSFTYVSTDGIGFGNFNRLWVEMGDTEYSPDGGKTWKECLKEAK